MISGYVYVDSIGAQYDLSTEVIKRYKDPIKYGFGTVSDGYSKLANDYQTVPCSVNYDAVGIMISMMPQFPKLKNSTSTTCQYEYILRLYPNDSRMINCHVEITAQFQVSGCNEAGNTLVAFTDARYLSVKCQYFTVRMKNGSSVYAQLSTGAEPAIAGEGSTIIDLGTPGIAFDPVWVYGYSKTEFIGALMGIRANLAVDGEIHLEDVEDATTINDYVNNRFKYVIPIAQRLFMPDTSYQNQSNVTASSTNLKNWMKNWLNRITSIDFSNIDGSIEDIDEGNVGDNDDTSDQIGIGELPNINILASGLITAYKVSSSELISLSTYMWDDTFIQSIPKLVNNPIDAIISLKSMPVDISNYLTSHNIVIGSIDTGISSNKITTQYIEVDCGSIRVKEYYGDFTDYNSTITIFLPYCGEHVLFADDVLESALYLRYRIDLLTGCCVAYLTVQRSRNNTYLNGPIYEYKGDLSINYPITSQTYGNILQMTGGLLSGNSITAVQSALNITEGKRDVEIIGGISSNFGALGCQTPYIKIVNSIEDNPSTYNQNLGVVWNKSQKLSKLKGYTKIKACNLQVAGATPEEYNKIDNFLKSGVII